MTEVVITFPAHCPVCGRGLNLTLERAAIITALQNVTPIRVRSHCHDEAWDLDQTSRDDLAIMARAFDL